MDFIIVTGRVSGKEYLVPLENISTIESIDGGADIILKREAGSKTVKKIECADSLKSIVKSLLMRK